MKPLFETEKRLQDSVESYFKRLEVPHERDFDVGAGCVDFALKTADGEPWGLLELKNGLNPLELKLSDAAGYLEQCAKYRFAADLPTFLGPFFIERPGLSSYFHGGHKPDTLASLSAFGGRLDVGLFFIQCCAADVTYSDRWIGFQFVQRQQRVAAYSKNENSWIPAQWPRARPAMVLLESAGSRRDRQ